MKKIKNSRRKLIAHAVKKIDNLINEGKLNLAYKILQELIPEYPEEEYLKYQLVRIRLLESKYEEALEILENLNEETNFILKTELYIKLGREAEEYYMYEKYFSTLNKAEAGNRFIRYKPLYIYLNKKYNSNFKIPENLKLSHLEEQIISYNKKTVIENIKHCHIDSLNVEKGVFYSNINIEELYEYANNYIKNHQHQGSLRHSTEIFKFEYPECGLLGINERANGFCAITILGNNKIIAMYPSRFTTFDDVIKYEARIKPKKLIKTKSGLERFNEKYGQQFNCN